MSPRVKDRSAAPSWPPMNSAILMSVQRFPDWSGRGRRRAGRQPAAPHGLTPQALRQQVSKVVGKGARMDALRRRPTRQNSTSTRATDQDGARRQARPGDRPRAGDQTTIEVLARRKKNNPVLIGERVWARPPSSKGWRSAWWRVNARDLARQAPGGTQHQRHGGRAKYRGEFEERVQKVLKEVTSTRAS